MNNRDRLIEIMIENGLDRIELAQLLSVKKEREIRERDLEI